METKTIIEHLEDLRRRIIVYLTALGVICVIAFGFGREFLTYLLRTVGQTIFLSPTEGFFIHVKIAVFIGFLVSSPILFYEVWAFLGSALKAKERNFIKIFCPLSCFLFLGGAAFAYFVILPVAMRFLLSYQTPVMQAQISTNQYLGFLFVLLSGFGFVFELPLVIIFLTRLNIIGPGLLVQKRKYAFLLIFITAAILTPPDVVTQILMALPLLILYESGIILSRVFAGRRDLK